VREQYFDGLAIIRSQDNWVVQWGDADEKNPRPIKTAKAALKGEFTIPLKNDKQFTRLPDRDGYAPQVGHSNGFPSARDPKAGRPGWRTATAWSAWGATTTPTAAAAASLYAVIGHGRATWTATSPWSGG
jgi:hypothetical protein